MPPGVAVLSVSLISTTNVEPLSNARFPLLRMPGLSPGERRSPVLTVTGPTMLPLVPWSVSESVSPSSVPEKAASMSNTSAPAPPFSVQLPEEPT